MCHLPKNVKNIEKREFLALLTDFVLFPAFKSKYR